MQTYQSTPDFYRDYLEHRSHKYIDKYKNKFGNWIYRYKTSKRAQQVSDARREAGVEADVHTADILKDKKEGWTKLGVATTVNSGVNQRAHFSGKAKSYGRDSGSIGSKYVKRENKYTKRADNTKKKIQTAYKYVDKRNDKLGNTFVKRSKAIRNLEKKEQSLKEASKMYKQRTKKGSGTATQRFNARMKEKQINEQIKALRKRKNKLYKSIYGKGSLEDYSKKYSNYSTWNR